MTPTQRALKDPEAYRADADRAAVLAAIDANDQGFCHETTQWMRRSAQDINEGGPLTIAAVETASGRSADARDRPHDRAFHNFAVLSAFGDHVLLQFLVRRANNLAEGIEPGAKKMLADAF